MEACDEQTEGSKKVLTYLPIRRTMSHVLPTFLSIGCRQWCSPRPCDGGTVSASVVLPLKGEHSLEALHREDERKLDTSP